MPSYQTPLDDMRYLLHEVFNASEHWQQLPAFAHCNQELADTVLEQAAKITGELIAPLNRPGDEQGVRLDNGQVLTPDGFRQAFATWAANGWVGLGGNPDYQGQGMPKMLTTLVEEMLNSASCSFSLYSILTAGAALAIDAHAEETLKQAYLPKLYSGEWAAAMALTEAHAGTDLGLLRSRAEPQADGSYRISGSKIFITGGDHDLTDNIVHLVLARLPDAPAGVKGISMFLVPKFLPDADGRCGTRNGFSCGALEAKMGIHASSTCVMHYDGATGWLVGEPHKGLAAMFTMMNYERLSVGIQGLGLAQLSYQGAAEYARERLQSRAPGSDGQGPADPIIRHGDVRRMLMTQKALVEAGRAFAVYTGLQLDIAKGSQGQAARQADAMVALLTPLAKAFLTDMAFDICVLGQQVYGGHGYIREHGMEQLVRDARITQIYEGTNGIQAMDLLARKVLGSNGDLLRPYLAEMQAFADSIGNDSRLRPFADGLTQAANTLEQLTRAVFANRDQPHFVGTAACDYLHVTGYTSFAYMWAKMAAVSCQQAGAFHDGKLKTGLFFMQRILPRIHALAAAVVQGADATMALDEEQF